MGSGFASGSGWCISRVGLGQARVLVGSAGGDHLFDDFIEGSRDVGASWLFGASETLLFHASEPLEPL